MTILKETIASNTNDTKLNDTICFLCLLPGILGKPTSFYLPLSVSKKIRSEQVTDISKKVTLFQLGLKQNFELKSYKADLNTKKRGL